ncbi:hypothetical protein PT974_04895 [Cladobotryum mycophilum]|uniref:Uncharacterized protein n=1 Tax=Cladobotryum mycophilum TaxID=491253 RepID=A0ABR0SQG9_9HYPO
MYIPSPQQNGLAPIAARGVAGGGHWTELTMSFGRPTLLSRRDGMTAVNNVFDLMKRQFSSNPTANTNAKIGIIVAFTVTAFVVGMGIFFFVYHRSIRLSKRRARRRRSNSTKSTKSKGSLEGELPAIVPPPAAATGGP